MTELLRLLSVRILNASKNPIGSGFLYVYDQENVFVLTAAHVLNDLTDSNSFWAECQPERDSVGGEISYFEVKRANVYSDYGPGSAPKDKWIANDAAVIRLQDIEDSEWIRKRMCEVRFAQVDSKLEECRFMGFGYPDYTAETELDLAEVEFEAECTRCIKYVSEKQKIRWDLGVKIANAKNKREYEGFSGSILAIAGLDEIVLAGVVQCVYKEFAGNEVLGADMTHIQRLLEDKKNGAGITVPKAENLKQAEIENAPVQSGTPVILAMPHMSDFNLHCVRKMLEGTPEGQSWAHILLDCPDVKFRTEIGQQMTVHKFNDDANFLGQIFPGEVLKILFSESLDETSVEAVMAGTYSEEIRIKVLEQFVREHQVVITQIISGYEKLLEGPRWERCFVATYQLFFELMGNDARELRYQMQICKTHDNMAKGMAMFTVYALLGKHYYEVLPQILKKSIEEIFAG